MARFVIGFAILAALFWLLETLWPEDRAQPKWRSDSWTDVAYFFAINGIAGRGLATLLAIAGVVLGTRLLPHSSGSLVSGQPAWQQSAEVVAIGVLVDYWGHRLFHQVPRLWRIHAIHHSPEKIDWLAAARLHPFDGVIQKLAGPAIVAMLGFPHGAVAGHAAFLAIYPIFLHANVRWGYGPLRWVIASPAYHRWHHASDTEALDKNFSGIFPWLDRLFGTAYFPKDRHPARYGLAGEPMPRRIFRQLAYPFAA